MLKLNTSMVFREKERKFKNIVSEIPIARLAPPRCKVDNGGREGGGVSRDPSGIQFPSHYLLQFELLFRRSVLGASYKRTTVDRFENGTLKVFFRLYLDRRKIPRSISNVEDAIEDIIAKETYSISSLFKGMELDLTSVSVRSEYDYVLGYVRGGDTISPIQTESESPPFSRVYDSTSYARSILSSISLSVFTFP